MPLLRMTLGCTMSFSLLDGFTGGGKKKLSGLIDIAVMQFLSRYSDLHDEAGLL